MFTSLASGSRGPWGHCIESFGKTIHSHRTSLHSGGQMGTREFDARGNPVID